MKHKIAILGVHGLLGSQVFKTFSADPEIEAIGIGREQLNAIYPTYQEIQEAIGDAEWVINCIGIIKPYIKDDAEEAIVVNSLFPHALSETRANIIQIATDCVFSGTIPLYDSYNENSPHDAHDIYGKTKSLGEIKKDNFYNIRCSIVGLQEGNTSLLQWFRNLPKNSEVTGFHGHQWNGVTTKAFAEVCLGIIKYGKPEVNNFHLVPYNSFTKYQILNVFAEVFNRPDIQIQVDELNYCNRRLETVYPENNKKMWEQIGYSELPSIQDLLNSLK